MREIGGYIEFEYFHGNMLHENGIKLDCGRSCLGYLIRARHISRIAMPSFMCDAVLDLCKDQGVQMDLYEVGYDLLPLDPAVHEDGYLYLCNYYGQLSEETVKRYREKYPRIIVDNSQAYFSEPVADTDTLYTCRKFFGVPDGGILYTTAVLNEKIEQSESHIHMGYLMGRLERTASEFYVESADNNDRFEGQPVRRMSKLTENILHGIDYTYIKERREENYNFLHECFGSMNRLNIVTPSGPYAYPLLVKDTDGVRKKLAQEGIYIPVLWPNVTKEQDKNSIGYDLAMNILPLPCDQRYDKEDMKYLCEKIKSSLGTRCY